MSRSCILLALLMISCTVVTSNRTCKRLREVRESYYYHVVRVATNSTVVDGETPVGGNRTVEQEFKMTSGPQYTSPQVGVYKGLATGQPPAFISGVFRFNDGRYYTVAGVSPLPAYVAPFSFAVTGGIGYGSTVVGGTHTDTLVESYGPGGVNSVLFVITAVRVCD